MVREYEINYSNFLDVQSHPGLRYIYIYILGGGGGLALTELFLLGILPFHQVLPFLSRLVYMYKTSIYNIKKYIIYSFK